MTRLPLFLALAPLTLLAACGDGPGDDAGVASGEVLEGTISDSMLPLDTVRSQPPLAEPRAVTRTSDDGGEAPEGEAGDAADEDGGTAPPEEATPAAVD